MEATLSTLGLLAGFVAGPVADRLIGVREFGGPVVHYDDLVSGVQQAADRGHNDRALVVCRHDHHHPFAIRHSRQL